MVHLGQQPRPCCSTRPAAPAPPPALLSRRAGQRAPLLPALRSLKSGFSSSSGGKEGDNGNTPSSTKQDRLQIPSSTGRGSSSSSKPEETVDGSVDGGPEPKDGRDGRSPLLQLLQKIKWPAWAVSFAKAYLFPPAGSRASTIARALWVLVGFMAVAVGREVMFSPYRITPREVRGWWSGAHGLERAAGSPGVCVPCEGRQR